MHMHIMGLQANCCDASDAYLSCAPKGRADASLAADMERYSALVDTSTYPPTSYHVLPPFSTSTS